jgi:hypothetical protein
MIGFINQMGADGLFAKQSALSRTQSLIQSLSEKAKWLGKRSDNKDKKVPECVADGN